MVGLQGPPPAAGPAASVYLNDTRVVSLAKHFAAYGAAAGGLNAAPADVCNRTLYEIYLRPWKELAKAGLRGLMPSHNTVWDVPMHQNHFLQTIVMRDRFGFGDGLSLSDCNDIGVLQQYRTAVNTSHAAALALKAGLC